MIARNTAQWLDRASIACAAMLLATVNSMAAPPSSVRASPDTGALAPAVLQRLAPDIAIHKRCLEKAADRLGLVAADPVTLAMAAVSQCRPALAPMAARLQAMGISLETRARVLAHSERMGAEFVARQALGASTPRVHKP